MIQGLYTIADNTFSPQYTPVALAHAYLKGGSRIVQLRMKSEKDLDAVYAVAREIVFLKRKYNFTFVVNDHVLVAKEIGADGVHVGKNDMPVAEVRERVGKEMGIGYSAHALGEAVEAEKAGADYVAFGAIFPSKTKGPGHPVQGLQRLQKVVDTLTVPVVAIGGIRRQNFRSVMETGVRSVAMITELTEAKDIVKRTKYFVKEWGS